MNADSQCDVRPCVAAACRQVVFVLPTGAGHPDFEKFSQVVNLCVNHYALAAIARDLLELLDIKAIELETAILPEAHGAASPQSAPPTFAEPGAWPRTQRES